MNIFHPHKQLAGFALSLACIAGMVLAMGAPARAELGGDITTVQNDSVHMKSSVRVTNATRYSVHEMHATGGTVVREFVSPAGKVFGIAWQGQFKPDLQQLLGDYSPSFLAAVQAAKAQRHGHGPLFINQPGIVIELAGHQRTFIGRVYVPQMVPQGVSGNEVQ